MLYLETTSLGSILVRSCLLSLKAVYTTVCLKLLFPSSQNTRPLVCITYVLVDFLHLLLLHSFLIPFLLGIFRNLQALESHPRLRWLVTFSLPLKLELVGFCFVYFSPLSLIPPELQRLLFLFPRARREAGFLISQKEDVYVRILLWRVLLLCQSPY